MKQTAVSWLLETINKKLNYELGPSFIEFFEQAKEMEKEQINKACFEGYYKDAEKYTYNYYNETFNNENNTQN